MARVTRSQVDRGYPDPRIGMPLEALDTPTLLLDRSASDRNIARMAGFFATRSATLRPHFKNHKCVSLARRQVAAGAVGMTCAKLGEAEVLVAHGFEDVLIANQVVGAPKVERLIALARRARIAVAVDHIDQATAISRAAVAAGVVIDMLIEVDIGMGRCGLPPGEPVRDLATRLLCLPGIRLTGLQAYEGHLVNITDRAERREKSRRAMLQAVETRRLLEKEGMRGLRISGSSTATHDATGTLDGVDEIQAGTYVTMDCQYARLTPEFEVALSILARVISRPAAGKAILDVGVKAAGAEFGVPLLRDHPDATIPFFLAEEHVVIEHTPEWPIGHLLQLIPSHACTTCNLHRDLVVHEAGVVVDVWPIEASGHLT